MAVSTGAPQFILINLSLFAVYAIWGLFGRNGAGELLNAFKENGNLPASNIPIKTVYTGIPQFDGLFVTLNTFFWQVIDGSAPTLSLQSFQFAGQVWGLWALMMLEGARAGNKGRVNSYVMLWGIAFQVASIGFVNPILMALSLLGTRMLSPTLSLALPSDPIEALTIPCSVLFGYALPLAVMCIPTPQYLDPDTKQLTMALWQVFPVWTSLSQQIFKLLVPRSSLSGKSDKEKAKHGMSALRAVYIIALIGAASTQIATLTLCFTSAMFPMLFNPASVAAWAPSKVLVPAAITPSLKVSSVAEGALLFLQYDEIIGSSALLLVVGNAVGKKWTPKGALQWLASVMGTATGYILMGPGGLAVVGMWVRDEILFAEEGEKGKRKN